MELQNNTTRFSDRADNYDLYRPGYPAAVVAWLEQTIGLHKKWVIADIGSGTGIFSLRFLEQGYGVKAVEPNAAMRSMAEKKLAAYQGFESVNGTAEETTLLNASADLITAAQAFHWFNLPVVKKEFKRILKPGGYVLLAWNILQKDTPFLQAYTALKDKYEEKNAHPDHADTNNIRDFFAPSPLMLQQVSNIQLRDAEGLKGLLLSSSKIPQPGNERYPEMIRELTGLCERFSGNGLLQLEYETKLYLAQIA